MRPAKLVPLVLLICMGGVGFVVYDRQQAAVRGELKGLMIAEEINRKERAVAFEEHAPPTHLPRAEARPAAAAVQVPHPAPVASGIYALSATSIQGGAVAFSKYAGLVTIVVNVASF